MRELLAFAHPVREQMRLDREVGDLAHVRARVGERHHRTRVAHDRDEVVGGARRQRLDEELLHVRLERQVDDELDRIDAPLGRDLGHARVERHQRMIEDAHAVVVGLAGLGADGATVVAVVRGVDEPGPDGVVAQEVLLLVERQRAELFPLGEHVEGEARLERRDDRDAA